MKRWDASWFCTHSLEGQCREVPDPQVPLVRGGEEVGLGQGQRGDRPRVLTEEAHLRVPKRGLRDVPHLCTRHTPGICSCIVCVPVRHSSSVVSYCYCCYYYYDRGTVGTRAVGYLKLSSTCLRWWKSVTNNTRHACFRIYRFFSDMRTLFPNVFGRTARISGFAL